MFKGDRLSPEQVSAHMNFEYGNADWTYHVGDISMAAKQTEGVAYLWNLLGKEQVAILADEVGMGKTFQALGLMHMLWLHKPDAKILVMAPNQEICSHWRREYATFVKHLYRNASTGACVLWNPPKAKFCKNLDVLADEVEKSENQLFLVTTHALSMLGGKDVGINEVKQKAEGIHGRIKSVLLQGFDLLIIDEAHYFRNVHGGSQRVNAGQAFFGSYEHPLGCNALLMTATPSHKGMNDVGRILGFFKEMPTDPSPEGLLKRFALRRLRLMRGQHDRHFNKHHYRNELALPATFEGSPDSELFFALYQKKLVSQFRASKLGKKMLYGYLEGFESTGPTSKDDADDVNATEPVDAEQSTMDYQRAPDSQLLKELSAQFHSVYGKFPDHPKYDVTVRQVVNPRLFESNSKESLHHHKHLVFVRRIPSVRELTQRVNRAYDQIFIPQILAAWGIDQSGSVAANWRKSDWSRTGFVAMTKAAGASRGNVMVQEDDVLVDMDDGGGGPVALPEPSSDAKLGSKVTNLFVVKKKNETSKDDIERTDCANVRLRFRKPESLFALFLEPALDYRAGPYITYFKSKANSRRDIYSTAARDQRLQLHRLLSDSDGDVLLDKGTHELAKYYRPIDTAWGLMHSLLSAPEQAKLADWHKSNPAIVENFANYLKEGFLFASPVMIELYCWFTEFQLNNLRDRPSAYQLDKVQDKYHSFVEFVRGKMIGSLMFKYFREALDTFDSLCEKIIDHELKDYKTKWTTLTHMHSPAWYASGESSDRGRLILGFNSPFFPNVLVATSVFQEGVNLHLQCRQVHHYGIAWTPGDNEQRVGRVDRLFGRVSKELSRNAQATLDIHFPYLAGSFDEDQVGSFVKNKHMVETAMDSCLHQNFDRAIDTGATAGEWKQYLRTPVTHEQTIEDPYPARFD